MGTTPSIAIAATLAALICADAASHPATAADACTATAKITSQSCKQEAAADLGIALGYCLNLPTKDTRKACRALAKSDGAEAKGECKDILEARKDLCEALGKEPYDPVVDPASFLAPAATAADPNPLFPLVPGTVWTYEGGGETDVVTVTNATKVIQGVTTIVVHDVVSVGGQVTEDTEDYFAQHADGTVWYFGELSKTFEDGELVDLHGSFRAGVDGAKPGIIMEAAPQVGDVYRQEFALGVAEDAAEVTSTTASAVTPGASCTDTCLETRDLNPLEPDAEEHKFYAPGVGLILTVDVETGERQELVSVVHN
jgi:hypothetical protein